MSAYGTVTCLAPAGHHPPKPSRQTRSFMKKPGSRRCQCDQCGAGYTPNSVNQKWDARRYTIYPEDGVWAVLRDSSTIPTRRAILSSRPRAYA